MPSVEDYQLPEVESVEPGDRYSRSNARTRYSDIIEKNRRRRRVLRVLGILVALALVVGGGYIAITSIGMTKQPFYMLLLGTDESIERNNDQSENSLQGVYRTDTIILARIDPVSRKASLISIPRDTQINLSGYGTQKINAAYALGGMDAAVRAVETLADVKIDHTAIVDMDGLSAVVDAVGGIDVEVPITIDDPDAQGYLEAGFQTLNGQQALVLCRSRNAYEGYDAPDLMRAANQRLVLQGIASKMLASDASTQAQAAGKLVEAVKTDLSVPQIAALMGAFAGIDTANDLHTASMPTTSVYEDELWYEIVDKEQWCVMHERIEQGLPPVDPNTPTRESAAAQSAASQASTEASMQDADGDGYPDEPYYGELYYEEPYYGEPGPGY